MTRPFNRSLRWITIAASAVAVLFAGRNLLSWAGFTLLEPYDWDASIYWTIGRGIVNGLTPYRDLFDYKMPGIFLISALSMKLSNGPHFGYLMEACASIAFAVLPALAVFLKIRRESMDPAFVPLSTAAFSAMMSAYLAALACGFQTEDFGSFAAGLYAVALFAKGERDGLVSSLLLSPLLLVGIGLKEPYVAIFAAVALINAKTPRQFSRRFLAPLVVAGILGLLILGLCGWLSPFRTYVHEILRVVSPGAVGPPRTLLERIFNPLLVQSLWDFSPPLAVVTIALPVIASARPWLHRARFWGRLLRNVGALLLASFAVNSGPITYDHHVAMAIPVYLAFFLNVQGVTAAKETTVPISAIAAVLNVLLLIGSIGLRQPPFEDVEKYRRKRAAVQQTANRVDDIVDACKDPAWASLSKLTSTPIVPGFTRHSPIGPSFFVLPHFSRTSEFMRGAILSTVERADLLVVQQDTLNEAFFADLAPQITDQIERDFDPQPWPCAGDLPLPSDGTRLFFRRGTRSQRPDPSANHP